MSTRQHAIPSPGGRPGVRGFAAAVLAAALAAGARAQDADGYYGDPVRADIENAYVRGLGYLAKSQGGDGTWQNMGGESGAPAVAGLAVLAFLAHGEDPNHGPFAPAIRRALKTIVDGQNARNGYIGSSMYNHGFATLALAEAYGAVQDPRIGPALKKAVDLILSSQERNAHGAWRYSPESTDADTTVSGACFVALMAARNAGLAVPDAAVDRALEFYRSCQTADGGIGYTGSDSGNGPRTAIGTLVAALARQQQSRLFEGAWKFLRQNNDAGGYFFYYIYYAAQAYFQADMRIWRDWNELNWKRLEETQSSDGSWQGPHGATFCTATALLSLALNYRFLPIYER